MAMKRCPDCGERYSDTYRYCPFCEEEEILREGGRTNRGGRRTAHGRQFNLLTPILIVLILVMGALLIHLLGGDSSSEGEKNPDKPGIEGVSPVQPGDEQTEETTNPEGTMPEEEESDTTTQTVSDYDLTYKLPSGLVLNKTDYTTKVGDPDVQLTVSGGSGNYSWVSQDESIAVVSSTGKVTAISSGTINVLVTDGNQKGVCIVRVKGGSSSSATPSTTPSTQPTVNTASLNRDDMTLKVGESFQLKLTGITTALTWSIGNENVATVTSNGTVKGVGSGNTTVKVSWDGGSASCIVRVK